MTLKPLAKLATASALVAALTGCATVVGEPEQTLTFTSSPSKAGLTITDERGKEIFYGETPATVTLQKSDGSYFGGKTYRIAFAKPGFDSHEVTISAKPNGWFIGGNILVGGIIGWLVVDPWSGNMYTLGEDYVDTTLRTRTALNAEGEIESLNVVLLDDLSAEQRQHLTPVETAI